MAYYSIELFSPVGVIIPDPLIIIEPGRNIFTALVTDEEGFWKQIHEIEGVRIVSKTQLDDEGNAPRPLRMDSYDKALLCSPTEGSGDDSSGG